ncbi:hypothetical protein RMSM_07134 [Rhodopirellula maiorica SM1]|uniref:Uncharacterized protein n=1 Tax=Rhodopirellula maiorica SM1 TaxID=1265738 RepID=M5RA69_9BACT|nr:hypothetical protein RMSM_07134 [Rhodopirellula maiorica SM1]
MLPRGHGRVGNTTRLDDGSEAFFRSETRREFRFYSRGRKFLRLSLQLIRVCITTRSTQYDGDLFCWTF